MREIKFRGKSTVDGSWAYGFFIKEHSYNFILSQEAHKTPVHPPSVGQYTGLKDSEGKDIYEGDILQLEGTVYEYEVKFENATFVCYHYLRDWGKWGNLIRLKDSDFDKYKYTVIGNIHDPNFQTTQQSQ